ncbi:unnamed protein product [Rotaria socialis]|uniref:Transmembrane protein n=1 Tax=Rotaria socialis TaxID=392032 RepID=A0A821ADW9_9BILA|nr:unnamed protein product [Rotaria socialis]CAF4574386.1 unnamed protein product [Rotaria socialis]
MSWCQYDLTDLVSGTKMSVKDDMFASVSNAFSNFAVLMYPFKNASSGGQKRCNLRYNTTDRYVHSVAVVGISKNSANGDQFMLVFAAEKMSTMTPYVCIGEISKSTCINHLQCTDVAPAGSPQQYFLIAVDSNGTFAYGFSSSFAFKLDIYANTMVLNLTTNDIWPSQGFIPHAIDVADTWAVIAGYGYSDVVKKDYATLGCLIDLSVLTNVSCLNLTYETTYLIPSNVVSYNELYELSVSIRGQKILVGVQRLSTFVCIEKQRSSLNVTNSYQLSYPDATSFGRVVQWADDTSIAVLVDNPYVTPWSTSEIFVYSERSVTLTTPVFAFPNSQQILGSRLSSPSFSRFGITNGGNMAILTDTGNILVVPLAPAGYVSAWVDTTALTFVFYFRQQLCIGGTYKNHSSLGSCQICGPRTMNPGTLLSGVLQCIPCSNSSSTSLCPLASLADVDSSKVPSYSQAVAYPETSDTTDMEDILLINVFQLSSDSSCLVISPIFWTMITIGICVSILVLMAAIKHCGCENFTKYRKRAKEIFKHTDIIGEGEMWAGGLATLSIFVLVGFSYWFSVSFIRRYPIEEITGPATFACDHSLVNAQFTSGLELLATPKSEEAQPLFDLLDAQTFYLTVELINTGFPCNSITAQENLVGSKYLSLAMNCSQSIPDAITSVTLPFPGHGTTIQVNMTGPYWIGAVRLCIRGNSHTNSNIALLELDFCQFYTTPNEAIGRITSIPISFVKNVNMTHALSDSDPNLYDGIWIPTFSKVVLSDEPYYVEFGNYLRYTSSLTVIKIALDERPFYIKNIEQPIVRMAELVFKAMLFTSLCIELFAFAFLIIKLVMIPVVRWILFLGKILYWKISKSDIQDSSRESKLNSSSSNGSQKLMLKLATDLTMVNETDTSISYRHQEGTQKKYSISNIELDSSTLISRL